MAFDLVPYRSYGGLDLWDAFFDVPHVHFREFDHGVPLDVSETKDTAVVEAEMPGMNSKDLDISLNGDLLPIRGGKKQEIKTKKFLNFFFIHLVLTSPHRSPSK